MKKYFTALLLWTMVTTIAQTPNKTVFIANVNTLKDTILIYAVRTGIPKGIRLALPEINPNNTIHATEIYMTTGYKYKGMLFLRMKQIKSKKYSSTSDQTSLPYVTIAGEKCASNGGITGLGVGKCKGMLQNKSAIPYRIEIQIEP